MKCRDAVDLFGDYVDKDISAKDKAAIDSHLAECPACRAYLSTYRKTIAITKGVMTQKDEEPLTEATVQRILANTLP